jgi:hypothetical protein
MTIKPVLLGLAMMFGCTSSSDKTDIGDATVGANSFHIFREGPAAGDGVMTTLVMKATTGAMPTSIVGWIGISAEAEEAAKVNAVYDAGDGDYDLDMTCPSPFVSGSKFWFAVDSSGTVATGSIALK